MSRPRDSQDFAGVVESFTVQPNLTILSARIDDRVKSCDGDGHLDADETDKVVITVMNTGTGPVENALASVKSERSVDRRRQAVSRARR